VVYNYNYVCANFFKTRLRNMAAPPSDAALGGSHASWQALLSLACGCDGRSTWELLAPVDAAAPGVRVARIQGSGLGVVATRPFEAGERVAAEAPLLRWPDATSGAPGASWPALERAARALPQPERGRFFGLEDAHARADGAPPTARGIWRSNAYATEDMLHAGGGAAAAAGGRSAVFALLCRVNHACVPNCHVGWSAPLGAQTLHAVRPIGAGEEVTVLYVGGAKSGDRRTRRAALRANYRFECACATCMLEGDALERSERRQARIAHIHRSLSASSAVQLLAAVEEQCSLLAEEGLPLVWAKAGLLLATIELQRSGETRAAAKLAARGAESARLALGEDSSVFERFTTLAKAFDTSLSASRP
jgi:hypothetical protein